MGSIIGTNVKLTIFGESHGAAIGGVLDNLPSGIEIREDCLCAYMERRKAGKIGTTPRAEADTVKILSGVFRGKTTGTPLAYVIENTNVKSEDYSRSAARPSHADYTGHLRYKGFNDYRGGGHFSGRLTAPIVAAGAIAAMCLKEYGIYALTRVKSIGSIEDAPVSDMSRAAAAAISQRSIPVVSETAEKQILNLLEETLRRGDSVGGVVECILMNIPAGIGNPIFEGFESALAKMIFSVPAVMGVEFGRGFEIARLCASEANDQMRMVQGKVVCATNNCGGINGGITNGMPIVVRAAIKPTPSISLPQKSVDYLAMKDADILVKGRHDCCIALRAPVVIESCALFTALDFLRWLS
ncbi:MAG: chorismate synthase [Clostridia bacterium]|nr:chorismate synthase [Clostridia bacterium]